MNRMGRPLREIRAVWPNFTYWFHTPKRCRECRGRMKRLPLSMAEYKCEKCSTTTRMHGEYISYRIELNRD